MRIAQISPLYESVPPRCYGGTERVVSYLTEALVELGHEVTLFASGDSRTSAQLVPIVPASLRTDERCVDSLAHHVRMVDDVLCGADSFDVLHWHIDYLHFPASRRCERARLTTLHGRLDLPDLPALYAAFPSEPVVSISDAQRRPLPRAHWIDTVYHGLPTDLYREGSGREGYFAFVGRISPRSASTAPSPSPSSWGFRCALPPKSIASISSTSRRRSHRSWTTRSSNGWARCTTAPRENSWAKRRRSCSPSTGPSPSVW